MRGAIIRVLFRGGQADLVSVGERVEGVERGEVEAREELGVWGLR
jgi:hypothetical protein